MTSKSMSPEVAIDDRDRPVVIVGAGHAGIQSADALRSEGYDGPIVLVEGDAAFPYQRPPLSKDFLGEQDTEPLPLPLRAESFFTDRAIDFRPGVAATGIDRAAGRLTLSDGAQIDYSSLVIATGAEARTLSVPGTDLAGVQSLRTLADAQSLRERLCGARHVVVAGAGFIGLEFAAVARRRGLEVTVLEAADRVMSRALTPPLSDYLAGRHREMGTVIRTGEGITALVGREGAVTSAIGTTAHEYAADLVLLGVGVVPRVGLARSAGLAVDNGIVVDHSLRTADPRIYAVGDCSNFPSPDGQSRLRLESVQSAAGHGRHVAAAIMGRADTYADLPLFWSHQGDVRLQIAGLVRAGDDAVIVGDVTTGRFSVFAFRDSQLVAVESVNRPGDHSAARRVLQTPDRPSVADVRLPGFTLKNFAAHLAPAS